MTKADVNHIKKLRDHRAVVFGNTGVHFDCEYCYSPTPDQDASCRILNCVYCKNHVCQFYNKKG